MKSFQYLTLITMETDLEVERYGPP
jgi:hypothetical protein